MSAFTLLVSFAFARATFALTDATCNIAYGQPSPLACYAVLKDLQKLSYRDDNFLSVASIPDQKPPGVDESAWNRRLTLPIVHSAGMHNSRERKPSSLSLDRPVLMV